MRYRLLGAVALGCAIAATWPGSAVRAQSDGCKLTDKMVQDALASDQPTRDAGFFSSNCAFHQWSWMLFIWLTQEVGDGELRFETMPTSNDVINGGQVDGQQTGVEMLAPRYAKTDDIDHPSPLAAQQRAIDESYAEVEQAGSSGVLIDQNGRAVYYSQYVNDAFYDWAVTEKALYKPANLRKLEPTTTLPANTLELKVSWKIVGDGEDAGKFFTTRAKIPKLAPNPNGPGVVPKPGDTEEVTVALVGFHVVGVVPDHPEMIWATFEHNDNAPNFASKQKPGQPVSDKDFTFYKAGTLAYACNENNARHLDLDQSSQKLSPVTQACRQFAFGNEPGASDAGTNKNNIQSLNASAWQQIDSHGIPAVWKNYREIGAVWFKPSAKLTPKDPLDTDAKLTGSLRLNNTTIETFTQDEASMNNCFKCHNTTMKYSSDPDVAPLEAKNVNISHILVNAFMQNQ